MLPAPAKLNLFLHVIGRRSDGYHTIESLFVPVSFGDSVSLALRDDGSVVGAPIAGVDEERDLSVRAARLLQRETGVKHGVDIAIVKRLPIGGGLGGGSSDAATVLLGLNLLWRLKLPRSELMRIGLALGADVPFFIFGEPALARGVGELLAPMSAPPTWFVVLTPPVAVSTASVFAAPELTRNSVSAKIAVFSEGYGRNDLQAAASARYPAIAEHVDLLRREGEPRMTGSGACVFALYRSEQQARHALSALPPETAAFVARALGRHPLWTFATP